MRTINVKTHLIVKHDSFLFMTDGYIYIKNIVYENQRMSYK